VAGESFDDGARREAREELGVELDPEPLFPFRWTDVANDVHGMVYRAVHDGPFRLQPEEIVRGEFVALDEVLRRATHAPFCPDGLAALAEYRRRTALTGGEDALSRLEGRGAEPVRHAQAGQRHAVPAGDAVERVAALHAILDHADARALGEVLAGPAHDVEGRHELGVEVPGREPEAGAAIARDERHQVVGPDRGARPLHAGEAVIVGGERERPVRQRVAQLAQMAGGRAAGANGIAAFVDAARDAQVTTGRVARQLPEADGARARSGARMIGRLDEWQGRERSGRPSRARARSTVGR
jgi:hypothetical protein